MIPEMLSPIGQEKIIVVEVFVCDKCGKKYEYQKGMIQ